MPLGLNDVTWESNREISLRSENGEPIRLVSETSPYMRYDDRIYGEFADQDEAFTGWLFGDYHEASANANLEFDEEDDNTSEFVPSDELDKFLSALKIKE